MARVEGGRGMSLLGYWKLVVKTWGILSIVLGACKSSFALLKMKIYYQQVLFNQSNSFGYLAVDTFLVKVQAGVAEKDISGKIISPNTERTNFCTDLIAGWK